MAAILLQCTISAPLLAGESGGEDLEERLPWAVSLSAGVSTPKDFTSIIGTPWTVSFEDTGIIRASGTRLIGELDEDTWVEGEVGIAKRFGESDAWDFSGLVFLRWDGVPWSEWVYTSFGVGVGPSYATEVSETERDKSRNDQGSRVLNLLVPEIALAHPDDPAKQLVFRLHHRSGIFGLIDGVSGGSTFVTVGGRWRF